MSINIIIIPFKDRFYAKIVARGSLVWESETTHPKKEDAAEDAKGWLARQANGLATVKYESN